MKAFDESDIDDLYRLYYKIDEINKSHKIDDWAREDRRLNCTYKVYGGLLTNGINCIMMLKSDPSLNTNGHHFLLNLRCLIEDAIDIQNLKKVPQYDLYMDYISIHSRRKLLNYYINNYGILEKRVIREGKKPKDKLFNSPADMGLEDELKEINDRLRIIKRQLTDRNNLINKYCELSNKYFKLDNYEKLELVTEYKDNKTGKTFSNINTQIYFKFSLSFHGFPFKAAPTFADFEGRVEKEEMDYLYNLRHTKYKVIYDITSGVFHNDLNVRIFDICGPKHYVWAISSILRSATHNIYNIFNEQLDDREIKCLENS